MNLEPRPILTEDWTAIVLAFAIIGLATLSISPILPVFNWEDAHQLLAQISAREQFMRLIFFFLFTYTIVIGAFALRDRSVNFKNLAGFFFLFLITFFAHIVSGLTVIKNIGVEIVLFSLLIGLAISNFGKVPEWIKPVIQTELFIKIGLVLLGCTIIFSELLQAGSLGMVQSLVVVLTVWQFCFWLGKKFKLDDELRTMLSSAVAICGVSAAIATSGAIKGDGKKLSYVISLVLITAIPMMLIMPYVAKLTGMSPAVAGAWLGGTIDTTGAVVAAGTLLGPVALKYATVVKFSQNVLLGIAAFAISIYWSTNKNSSQERPSLKTIWERFPKFVIGFILASFLFSFVLSPDIIAQVKTPLKGLQTFWFAIAFTCIGLETKFTDVFKMDGGRPAFVFLLAQTFNILVTLLVAWLLFS